ncbi:hypothetical protein HW555_000610 [Spodoptera exigua]|uniref:Uncharacterized protein n=1 Tax=Spodoptera exigua TaxID=7107 RepID=A0A835LB71_SPOEX|nr:hypothetical protein HW555_000610 [Spodoptera exigua]
MSTQDDFSVGVTHFSQDNILGNGPGDAPQNLNPRNIVNKYIAPSLKKKNKFRNKIERKKLKKKFSKINTIQPVADIASASGMQDQTEDLGAKPQTSEAPTSSGSAIPILENSIHINVRNKMKEIKKQKLNWKKQDNNAPASAQVGNPGMPPIMTNVQAGNPGIPPNMTNVQAGNPGMQPNMANVQAGNPGMLPNMINVQAGNPGMPPNMANVQTGNPGMPPNMINFQAGNSVMQPNMAAATGPASSLAPAPFNTHALQPNVRSTADDFFSPHQRRMMDMLETIGYKGPKGIPRTFIVKQMQEQYMENQTMTNETSPTYHQESNMVEETNRATSPMFDQTDSDSVQQPYSPSDIYSENANPEPVEETESSEGNQNNQKRLSAFHRLGPVSQPKKPKLTINLNLNKDQPVREVVDETNDDPEKYTPTHLRKNIIASTDETVMKYLPFWPWKKNFGIRKSVTARNSKTAMLIEQEKMEKMYEKDNAFIQISIKGYPSSWTKEQVLDAVLDCVKEYSLIPCFVEFYQHECKFLTLRTRSALIILHKTGFYIHKDGVELTVTISVTDLTLNLIDFIPRLILRKRMAMGHLDKKLNLSAFTLQDDISHFLYFPLNRLSNQKEFVQVDTVIEWSKLTALDISHNRLKDISGFDLQNVTPNLKHLNLSHNYLDKIISLINCRSLPLKSIHLEGNPLCLDYIDPEHYIKVLRLLFPAITEIDGVPIQRSGEMPQFKRNYCPDEAKAVTEKFLEIYFPLLDAGPEHRSLIQGIQTYRLFRNLFLYARFLDEGEIDSVTGAMAITKLVNRWPKIEHDPHSFSVDVMSHTPSTTILRVSGMLKLIAETEDDDEHLLAFTRTVVLHSEDGDEYKIHNEMVYWDEPTAASARSAFRVSSTVPNKQINLKIESTTDEDLRDKYLQIFMKFTTMDKKISERCLEKNDWNFKLALEHFTKLLKNNNLGSLTQEEQTTN